MTSMHHARWMVACLGLTVLLGACGDDSSTRDEHPTVRGGKADGHDVNKHHSCENHCGDKVSDSTGHCWCDDRCAQNDDCCFNIQDVCACTPKTCAPDDTGEVDDGCGGTLVCGDETSAFLVGSDGGELALVAVDSWTVEPIDGTIANLASSVRYADGFFYILTDKPESGCVVVDASSAQVVRSMDLQLDKPRDLAMIGGSAAYVSGTGHSALLKLDLDSGQTTGSLDLSRYAPQDGSVHAEKMVMVDQRLFVQLQRQGNGGVDYRSGAVAVIDVATDEVIRVIELDVPRPDFSMVVDAPRNRLLVAAIGGSHGLNGGIRAIDLRELTLTDFLLPAYSGSQGAFLLAHDNTRLFVIYHTEVPFVSTHLVAIELEADGTVSADQPFNETLYDSWDGHDSLASDSSGQFVAIPDACFTGMCVGSIGLHVFNAATTEEVQTLSREILGFAPSWTAYSSPF